MATCKTSVKRLLDNYTYYAVLNEIRNNAKAEGEAGKPLASALFDAMKLAETLDDSMEPEGDGSEDEDGEGEDEDGDESEE